MWEDIKQQVAEIISYSQGIDINALNGVDDLIEKWWRNKSKFYGMNGQLIIKSETPITFEMDYNARRKQLENFIGRIEEHYHNRELAIFLGENFKDFYSNILQREYYTDDYTIKKGTKIIKAFKYFVPDKDELHAIQDEASMLIQENKITGYLCLSIHPLDFLSSSENTYKWRSCHALDGDYRTGNLDYMVDDSTVICYIEGAKDVKLPNFPASVPWNSKKWRMLLHFSSDRDLVFAGRQYPFESKSALDCIRTQFLPTIMMERMDYLSYWHNDVLDSNQFHFNYAVPDPNMDNWHWGPGFKAFIPNRIPMIDTQVIQIQKRHYHYNDLLFSTVYNTPYYLWSSKCDRNSVVKIGGDVKCVCCGQNKPYGAEAMICNECDMKYIQTEALYCDCCESRIYPDEEDYVVMADDSIICQNCADTCTRRCEVCGEVYYTGNLRESRKLNKQFVCAACLINVEPDMHNIPFMRLTETH